MMFGIDPVIGNQYQTDPQFHKEFNVLVKRLFKEEIDFDQYIELREKSLQESLKRASKKSRKSKH